MTVKITRNVVRQKVGKVQTVMKDLPLTAYQYWRKITPIDTGNAKRKTRLRKNVIHANYPYAERLDDGYSKQAPRGMYEPTVDHLRKELNKRLKRVR